MNTNERTDMNEKKTDFTRQLGFYFDASRCTGCKTCAVACRDKNGVGVDRAFRRVLENAGGSWEKDDAGAWRQNVFAYYVSVSCNHCEDPLCTRVCPTGAHAKHPEKGGLVLIDEKKCVGCGNCSYACPYGAPQYDVEKRKMTKCDGCLDRLEEGRLPACVEACPQRALDFGPVEELRRRYGEGALIAPLAREEYSRPNLVVRGCRGAEPAVDRTFDRTGFEKAYGGPFERK